MTGALDTASEAYDRIQSAEYSSVMETRVMGKGRRFCFFVLVALLGTSSTALLAQGAPAGAASTAETARAGELLSTYSLRLPAPGEVHFALSFGYQHDLLLPYSGLHGKLWQVARLRLDLGLGKRVALVIRGTPRQVLQIDRQRSHPTGTTHIAGGTVSDYGDFEVATLVRLAPEHDRWPALGFRVGFKLPNTDDNKGIGTDTTDLYFTLLAEKHLGRLAIFTDTGMGILTQAGEPSTQKDVILYGLGSTYSLSSRFSLVAEIAGRWSHGTYQPGTEDHSRVQVGGVWSPGRYSYHLLVSRGLTRFDETFGIQFGISTSRRFAHWHD